MSAFKKAAVRLEVLDGHGPRVDACGSRTVEVILDSPWLNDAEKEAIAGGNLLRVLRIDT